MHALDDAVEALQRDVVDVDDGHAVEILEPGPERDDLQQVGHDLDVDALAAGGLDAARSSAVLLRRQRHIQVIDRLARAISPASSMRAEQRQAAVAEVIAGRPVVDEADDLVAELAVLEDLVRDEAAQFAGAGNQDPLQARCPARHRRSRPRAPARASANVSTTLRTRKMPQTACDTS